MFTRASEALDTAEKKGLGNAAVYLASFYMLRSRVDPALGNYTNAYIGLNKNQLISDFSYFRKTRVVAFHEQEKPIYGS